MALCYINSEHNKIEFVQIIHESFSSYFLSKKKHVKFSTIANELHMWILFLLAKKKIRNMHKHVDTQQFYYDHFFCIFIWKFLIHSICHLGLEFCSFGKMFLGEFIYFRKLAID